MVTNNTRTVTP